MKVVVGALAFGGKKNVGLQNSFSHCSHQNMCRVHFDAAFLHLQCLVQPFLLPQCTRLEQACDASGSVVQRGCQPASVSVNPQSEGLGNCGLGTKARFHYVSLVHCSFDVLPQSSLCRGMFSSNLDLWVKSCFLASLTSKHALVLS